MKKSITLTLAMGAAMLAVSGARAEENWAPHLAGVFEGSEAGALPPQGVYFVNETLLTGTTLYGDSGSPSPTGIKADIAVDVPILLWVPGVKFLGADYALGIAQPFDYVSTRQPGAHAGGTNLGTGTGLFNTLLIPAELSWKLPNDFYVKTALGIYLPDGDFERADKMAIANGMGFGALEPSVGVSWLHDGWNASVSFAYNYNFKNTKTDYQSGDVIDADYTLTKTFGKWTVGAGGYTELQLAKDSLKGVTVADSKLQKDAVGPIIGYNFGPVILQAEYNFQVNTTNTVQGNEIWIDLTVPL
jgi:hypothetical protein